MTTPQPQTDEQWIDELLTEVAYCMTNVHACHIKGCRTYGTHKEHSVATAKSQILQKMNEVYKNGYVKGGIDEILRHDKATQAVIAALQNSKGDV